MTKERELLEQVLDAWSKSYQMGGLIDVIQKIREFLAARKPMTNEEIIQGVTVDTSDDFHAGYWAGIRYAEKFHGIGGKDES